MADGCLCLPRGRVTRSAWTHWWKGGRSRPSRSCGLFHVKARRPSAAGPLLARHRKGGRNAERSVRLFQGIPDGGTGKPGRRRTPPLIGGARFLRSGVTVRDLAQPFGARLKRSQVCLLQLVSLPAQDGFSRSGYSYARPSNGAAAGDRTAERVGSASCRAASSMRLPVVPNPCPNARKPTDEAKRCRAGDSSKMPAHEPCPASRRQRQEVLGSNPGAPIAMKLLQKLRVWPGGSSDAAAQPASDPRPNEPPESVSEQPEEPQSHRDEAVEDRRLAECAAASIA